MYNVYIYIQYTYKHIILVYPSNPTSDDDPQWSLFWSSGLQGINFVIDLSQEIWQVGFSTGWFRFPYDYCQ